MTEKTNKRPSPFAFLFLDEESSAGTPEGGEIQRLAGSLAQILKPWIVDPNVSNYEGRTIHLSPDISIKLGKTLGTGWFGTAYRVEQINDLAAAWLEVDQETPLVAKVPHALKTINPAPDLPLALARKANQREARTYRLFLDHIDQIEAAYPAPPAWEPGHLPVVPILAEIPCELGTVLIKPEVKGLGLREIYERFGVEPPTEIIDGLKEIYHLVQSIHQSIQVPVRKLGQPERTEGLSVDIRPTNLIWIEDARLRAQLRLSRPGFLLFELDQVPQNFPQYLSEKTSFENYLDEFRKYLVEHR